MDKETRRDLMELIGANSNLSYEECEMIAEIVYRYFTKGIPSDNGTMYKYTPNKANQTKRQATGQLTEREKALLQLEVLTKHIKDENFSVTESSSDESVNCYNGEIEQNISFSVEGVLKHL